MVLGYNLAPLIQSKLEQRARAPIQTVLASSQPPKPDSPQPPTPAMEAASFELMRQLAQDGDPVAEYALGLRYFQGDDKNGTRSRREASLPLVQPGRPTWQPRRPVSWDFSTGVGAAFPKISIKRIFGPGAGARSRRSGE